MSGEHLDGDDDLVHALDRLGVKIEAEVALRNELAELLSWAQAYVETVDVKKDRGVWAWVNQVSAALRRARRLP